MIDNGLNNTTYEYTELNFSCCYAARTIFSKTLQDLIIAI